MGRCLGEGRHKGPVDTAISAMPILWIWIVFQSCCWVLFISAKSNMCLSIPKLILKPRRGGSSARLPGFAVFAVMVMALFCIVGGAT